jgi:CRP-like cAMP-binding protein
MHARGGFWPVAVGLLMSASDPKQTFAISSLASSGSSRRGDQANHHSTRRLKFDQLSLFYVMVGNPFLDHHPWFVDNETGSKVADSNPNYLFPLVIKLKNWAHLDDDDVAAILALPHTSRRLTLGQYIVREGDVATHSCLVVEGFAMRHKVVGDGGRQIINIHMAGDMVDLQNALLSVADHNVQTLTPMVAAFVPREAIVELAFARPAVGRALWLETLVEGSISREWIANVGRRDARTRVAHLLCEFAMRLESVGLGEPCNYELPMTQEQIADTVGLTPVHVNRTLRALDGEGLTRRSKRSVVIQDWKKLTQTGDFNSVYLHLPRDSL